uniref:Cation-transporting ATPase n=1 Tax=Rhabditophanes sp. KR3021 TaxID=114890 RepID=A0AC35THH9_9BILA
MGASGAPSSASQKADQHVHILTSGEETITIFGYLHDPVKTIISILFSLITFGLLQIVFYWYPAWKVACQSSRCRVEDADLILVVGSHKNVEIKKVKQVNVKEEGQFLEIPNENGTFIKVKQIKMFEYRKINYIWHPKLNKFESIELLEGNIPITHFHEIIDKCSGFTVTQVALKVMLYGRNAIDVTLTSIPVLLIKEVISPFYMFQIFSVIIWYSDNYAYYASIIVVMSMLSIGSDVFQIRKQEKNLRTMVHSQAYVKVIRNGGITEEVRSDELIPGDILLVPQHGCNLQCDAILMHGSVIVNEAMLTGESVPVTKVTLPQDHDPSEQTIFSFKEHSKHILFCGTTVLQTRNHGGKPAMAIVLRTAYSTLKGELVRSIMYPKPVDFSFTKDLFKFVGFLVCIAGCGFVYTFIIMAYRGSTVKKIIIRTLDIITIVVPPALPAAMSIGILNAQMRLKAKEIFCISPSVINTCGAINTVCFDKTGTLTEDGLDFHCMKAVDLNNTDSPTFKEEVKHFEGDQMNEDCHFMQAIATCHSLTKIDGELCGDPLDIILFQKSGFVLEETSDDNKVDETERIDLLQPTIVKCEPTDANKQKELQLAIIRQFTFSSTLQRMTVVVHNTIEGNNKMHLYCKGAPEMVAGLCDPASIPPNYSDIVNQYAQHGYRLIAIAYRDFEMSYLKAQRVPRAEIECELKMLGLVVMENRIKPQTLGVINQLNNAHIRTIMVTGDNLLTALSVARECAIIRPSKRCYILDIGTKKTGDIRTGLVYKESVSSSEEYAEVENISVSLLAETEKGQLHESSYHFAVAGPTFEVICQEYPELIDKLVCVCDVYARMSPDQKQLLINRLQEVNYTVAMCGDGANDCAALKAAHAGISLSAAEASIAAPFTSKTPDITCVPTVIREGRAALVTSFGIFKYMAGYSLTQFITIMQLYWLGTNLTDFQFLYIDLLLITLVALTFGATPACEKLSRIPPPTRLLSLASIVSILGQLCIIGSHQLFAFIYTSHQSWFKPYSMPLTDDVEDKRSMQGTAIFCVSTFQYITLAIIYSKGHPFRKSIFSNRPLIMSLSFMTIVSTYIILWPSSFVAKTMEFDPIPYFADRLLYMMLGLLSAFTSYMFETFVIDYLILSVRERIIKKKNIQLAHNERDHNIILTSIGGDTSWFQSIADQQRADAPSVYYTPIKVPISNSNSSSVFVTPSKSLRDN